MTRPISDLVPDVSWKPLAPFWSGCARRELRFPRCFQCGRYQWYPRDFCAGCMGDEFTWTAIDPVGSVYSYTVLRRAFLPGSDTRVPFTVLQIEFDEAPGVILVTNLADADDAGGVHVGAPVEVSFTDVQTTNGAAAVTMPYVRLRPSP